MISIERAKELIGDKNMPDEEVDKVRHELRALAEIIFERWVEGKKRKNNNLCN